MKAKDIMTSRVVTVGPVEPIAKIAATLVERNISAVPVVDSDGKLCGIVSEGDLLHRPEIGTEKASGSWWLNLMSDPGKLADAYTKAHGKCARDVMTTPVISVDENAAISEIAETLERNRIKRVPVVRDGTLVGIVSRANIVQEVAAAPSVEFSYDGDDQAIRQAIEKKLFEQAWASAGATNVTVRDGVVELWGTIGTGREVAATRVLAEEIDGVKAVKDHRVRRPLVPAGGL